MARQKSSSGSRRGGHGDRPTRTPDAGKPQHLGDLKDGDSGLAPGLYVTATPIGNARDITLRALDVLKGCDLIAAEDTRVTAKLLAIHGIAKPLTAYNDHNAAAGAPAPAGTIAPEKPHRVGERRRHAPGLRSRLQTGAGRDRGKHSRARPARTLGSAGGLGAVSGLPSDRFLFAGFLSSKSGERKTTLEEFKSVRATLIFFESAHAAGGILERHGRDPGSAQRRGGARDHQAARRSPPRRSGRAGRRIMSGKARPKAK